MGDTKIALSSAAQDEIRRNAKRRRQHSPRGMMVLERGKTIVELAREDQSRHARITALKKRTEDINSLCSILHSDGVKFKWSPTTLANVKQAVNDLFIAGVDSSESLLRGRVLDRFRFKSVYTALKTGTQPKIKPEWWNESAVEVLTKFPHLR